MSEEISSEISSISPAAVGAGARRPLPGDCTGEPHANATATTKRKGAKRTS